MTDAEILAIADATMFTKPDTVWQDDALKFARAILAATPDRSVGACSRCKGSSYVITGLGESAGAEECPACVGGHADRSVGEVPSVPENVMHAIGNLGTKAKNFGVAMQAKPGFSKDEQAAFLGAHEALVFAVKQALAADRSARGGAKPDFGDYVTIEQKRFGAPNEFWSYKVIGRLESNYWMDVPASPAGEVLHDHTEPILLVMPDNLDHSVYRVRVADVKLQHRAALAASPAAQDGGQG